MRESCSNWVECDETANRDRQQIQCFKIHEIGERAGLLILHKPVSMKYQRWNTSSGSDFTFVFFMIVHGEKRNHWKYHCYNMMHRFDKSMHRFRLQRNNINVLSSHSPAPIDKRTNALVHAKTRKMEKTTDFRFSVLQHKMKLSFFATLCEKLSRIFMSALKLS